MPTSVEHVRLEVGIVFAQRNDRIVIPISRTPTCLLRSQVPVMEGCTCQTRGSVRYSQAEGSSIGIGQIEQVPDVDVTTGIVGSNGIATPPAIAVREQGFGIVIGPTGSAIRRDPGVPVPGFQNIASISG